MIAPVAFKSKSEMIKTRIIGLALLGYLFSFCFQGEGSWKWYLFIIVGATKLQIVTQYLNEKAGPFWVLMVRMTVHHMLLSIQTFMYLGWFGTKTVFGSIELNPQNFYNKFL